MKYFRIDGSNGSYIELEDSRYADTVYGDTSEDMDAHEALSKLADEGTQAVTEPMHSHLSAAEIMENCGA